MPFKAALALVLLLNVAASKAQQAAYLSQKEKHSNIVIISTDGLQLKGRVLEVTLDYILLDARDFNSPVTLSAYYIRPRDNFYKIDVEYIQAAVLKAKKKKVAENALAGAVEGALKGSEIARYSDANISEAASAAGLAIGGVVGAAKGLGRRKLVIPIYGLSENLMKLLSHYE